MLVQFDCYKCIFNQIVEMARSSSADDAERRRMLRQFIGKVVEHAGDSTPPEMAAHFYSIYAGETGIEDPYAQIKAKSTELARQLYGEFETLVRNAGDPLATALRIVIGGNVIDFGANPDFQLSEAAEAIRRTVMMPLDEVMLETLRGKIGQAGNVFYILDNCGEAVLDRLLLEYLGGPKKVTLGVRGKPILNDITPAELAASGLADYPVIDTGDRAPGVSLRYSAPEFLRKLYTSDLVIAKGQGNFESLGGCSGIGAYFFPVPGKVSGYC